MNPDSDAIERVAPHVPGWNGAGKYQFAFGFEGGSLIVYGGGFGTQDGNGYFCFKDDDLEFEQDIGPLYRIANVANSELVALRDKLNEIFPLALAKPTPVMGDDADLIKRAHMIIGTQFTPTETALVTELATRLQQLSVEVARKDAAITSALEHRYGNWTSVLYAALQPNDEGARNVTK